MRWLLAAALVVGCGQPPECGISIAEDIFVVTAIDTYNATIGPTGGSNTFFCPGGGTAIVNGTTSPIDATSRLDNYTVTYDHCFDSAIDTKLTLTGQVTYQGDLILDSNAFYCKQCIVLAMALTIEGSEDQCDPPNLAMTCKVDFKVHGTAANVPQQYDGSICDFTFP
jgi:hypothetical protein